jgi:hypothetical protein
MQEPGRNRDESAAESISDDPNKDSHGTPSQRRWWVSELGLARLMAHRRHEPRDHRDREIARRKLLKGSKKGCHVLISLCMV